MNLGETDGALALARGGIPAAGRVDTDVSPLSIAPHRSARRSGREGPPLPCGRCGESRHGRVASLHRLLGGWGCLVAGAGALLFRSPLVSPIHAQGCALAARACSDRSFRHPPAKQVGGSVAGSRLPANARTTRRAFRRLAKQVGVKSRWVRGYPRTRGQRGDRRRVSAGEGGHPFPHSRAGLRFGSPSMQRRSFRRLAKQVGVKCRWVRGCPRTRGQRDEASAVLRSKSA